MTDLDLTEAVEAAARAWFERGVTTPMSHDALRSTADAVWDTWTAHADADVAALAREVARVLRRLAERVECGR
jgi:hypothetical protein